MTLLVATEPRSRDRPNEDWALVTPDLIVVLDGATTRTVFGLLDWSKALNVLSDRGPVGLIAEVRTAEAADPNGFRWPRNKTSDDATAVLFTPDG